MTVADHQNGINDIDIASNDRSVTHPESAAQWAGSLMTAAVFLENWTTTVQVGHVHLSFEAWGVCRVANSAWGLVLERQQKQVFVGLFFWSIRLTIFDISPYNFTWPTVAIRNFRRFQGTVAEVREGNCYAVLVILMEWMFQGAFQRFFDTSRNHIHRNETWVPKQNLFFLPLCIVRTYMSARGNGVRVS